MATAVTLDPGFVPPTTAEELLLLPDGMHGEIVRGVFVPMSPTHSPHGSVTGRVSYAVMEYVYPRGAGEVFAAETCFRLARRPDTVRCPDVGFVTADRLPLGVQSGVFEGAPDLAVEVLSPSNSYNEMSRKTAEYLRAGGRQVWIVDPDARTVTTHTAGGLPRFLEGDDVLEGGDLLPGFSAPVAQFFAGLAAPGAGDEPAPQAE